MPKITPHRVENGTALKRCSKCKDWKQVGEYHKAKKLWDGLTTACKECRFLSNNSYYRKNKEKIKARTREYNEKNKEKIKAKTREYKEKNKEKLKAKKREYNRKNKEKNKIKRREYIEKNKEQIKEQRNKRLRQRRKEDPLYRMSMNIRANLRYTLRRAKEKKQKSTFKYVGCTPEFLLARLQRQCKERGLNEYEVDHMMPVSSFDLRDPEQLRRAWNISNLQALSPQENLRKSGKIVYDMKWAGDEWVIRTKEGNGLYRPTALFRSVLSI
mgnify:CR=1 FL=1|jgi:hypothetical protein